MGNRIVGAKAIPKSKIPGLTGRFQGHPQLFWKYEIGQLFEEARMTNYLGYGERGAAICLRIILEKVICVHILRKNPKNPRRFGKLEPSLDKALKKGTPEYRTASDIKHLGDAAAHPSAYGNFPVTPGRVDYAISQLEDLLGSLGAVQ